MSELSTFIHDRPIRPGAAQSRLVPAILAAAAAALVGALLWAGITAVTNYQIGFMAIGVGVLVGFAVRVVGKGQTIAYRLIAAAAAGLGCAVGNLLTGAYVFANEAKIPIGRVLEVLDLELTSDIMTGLFSPIDLLFYGLAIHQAWKLAVDDGGAAEEELLEVEETNAVP